MKKGEKAEKKGSLGPLVPALLAGGALIGAAFLGSAAEANAPGGRATTYQSLNGAAGFLAAGTKTGTQAVRSAQTYDAYCCYNYGYFCCDPDTVEGREACCYYYGTYCNQSSGANGTAKHEDDYVNAGFAGTGVARRERERVNPLL